MFSVRQRIIGLCLALSCMTSVQAEDLHLNGTASYQNLGQEKFIAALYLTAPSSSPQDIYASDTPKRMKVLMTTGFSKRRWVNLWMQGMAINNSSSAFSTMADALVEMFEAQSGGLKPNDIVTIDYDPDSGCSYRINGVELVSHQPPELFELFLSAWVGNVPPSSDFRQAILGQADSSELAERLPTFVPSAERIATIESWVQKESPKPELAAKQTLASAESTPPKATEPEEPEAAIEPEVPEITQPQIASNDTAGDPSPSTGDTNMAAAAEDESTVPDSLAMASTEEIPALPADIASPFTDPQNDLSQNALAANSAANPDAQSGELQKQGLPEQLENEAKDDQEEENEDISVDMILAIREYTHTIIRQVYKSIKYPSSALRNGHEGGVRLLVSIDRQGKLMGVETAEPSEFSSLNEAATRAVAKSAPFPKIPDIISDDPLEVTLPITFKIQ